MYFLSKQRPDDFFGFADYSGIGDPDAIIASKKESQRQWDERYKALSLWQKLLFFFSSEGITLK